MSGICAEKSSVLFVTPEDVVWLRTHHPNNYKKFCAMVEAGLAEVRIPTQRQENGAYQRYKDGKQEGAPIPPYERGS